MEMIETRPSVVRSPLFVFCGLSVAFGVLLAGPAWLVAKTSGLVGLATSAFLCVVPGCVALGCRRFLNQARETTVLVAGGLRFGLVLAAALVAKEYWPEYGISEFFVWLVLFYLFTLAVETWLILKPSAAP